MGRWFIVDPVLSPVKANRHATYRQSEKGKQRDYRRYKKKLAVRMLIKQARLAFLEKELMNVSEI